MLLHSCSRSQSSANPFSRSDDVLLDHGVDGGPESRLDVGALQHLATVAVDRMPLPVHHVVVLE